MNMKKIASLLLALVLVLAMAVPAMAAMEGTLTGGSITINDAVSGQTYNAYQLLYIESYDATNNAYSYKANSAWETWLKTQTSYVSFDAQGYVTWVADQNDATVAAFAKAAQAYAKTNSIAADATANATTTTVSFTELKLGYYLVDTTLGTLCSLDTTNPTVVMREKNEAPESEKEVQEDSDSSWGDKNDADIDQTVNFKATITVQAGAENYILHDTMSTGLTYKGVTSVKIGETDVAAANYSVTAPGTCGCTFEVKFNNTYIASLTAGTEIVVYYFATLNENAVVAGDGNKNEVKLQYGDESKPSYTPVDETITYTWELPVFKYTGSDKTPLAGAGFTLYTDKECTNVVKLTAKGDNVYKVDAEGTVTEITTDTTGSFEIEGLDSDTYYLKETTVPNGYNALTPNPATIVISDTGAITYNGTTTAKVEIENKTGTELPSTGGMGTTILYVAGGVLVLAAVVLLITKKRMAASK